MSTVTFGNNTALTLTETGTHVFVEDIGSIETGFYEKICKMSNEGKFGKYKGEIGALQRVATWLAVSMKTHYISIK